VVLVFRWATTTTDPAIGGVLPSQAELEADGWEAAGCHPVHPSSVLMFRPEAPGEELAPGRPIR